MTKAQQTREEIDSLIAGGMSKADAFRQIAERESRPVDSIRGSYYSASRSGGRGKPRRRETTAEDAVADARAALERAVENIDLEVAAAEDRAKEAAAEHKALKASATSRKAEIQTRIEALS